MQNLKHSSIELAESFRVTEHSLKRISSSPNSCLRHSDHYQNFPRVHDKNLRVIITKVEKQLGQLVQIGRTPPNLFLLLNISDINALISCHLSF